MSMGLENKSHRLLVKVWSALMWSRCLDMVLFRVEASRSTGSLCAQKKTFPMYAEWLRWSVVIYTESKLNLQEEQEDEPQKQGH